MTWTRRKFGTVAGAAGLAALSARAARSQANGRVVVIGGGIGGATVAKVFGCERRNTRRDVDRAKATIYDLLLQ